MPLAMPALGFGHTQRACEGCQVRLCDGWRRERSDEGGKEKQWRGCLLTCNREADRPTARRWFSTLIPSAARASPIVAVLERRALPSAAANTNFEADSGEELVENCASICLLQIPRNAAARGVTSAGSAGPHRAPLAPTPCGGLPDETRDQATATTECGKNTGLPSYCVSPPLISKPGIKFRPAS